MRSTRRLSSALAVAPARTSPTYRAPISQVNCVQVVRLYRSTYSSSFHLTNSLKIQNRPGLVRGIFICSRIFGAYAAKAFYDEGWMGWQQEVPL